MPVPLIEPRLTTSYGGTRELMMMIKCLCSGHAYLWGEWDGHLPGIARGINHLRIIRVDGLDSEYEVRMKLKEVDHNSNYRPLFLLQWIKLSMPLPLLHILINLLLILHRILLIMMNHSRKGRRRKDVALSCKI